MTYWWLSAVMKGRLVEKREKRKEKEGLLQYFGFVGLGLVWFRLLLLDNYGPTGDSGQIGHSH